MTEHPTLLWPLLVRGSGTYTHGNRYGNGYTFSSHGGGFGDGTDIGWGDGNGFGEGSAGTSHGDGFGRSAHSNE
jgi:hypothetical protein